MPAERFPDLFYCMVPHHFTETNEAATEEQPHGEGLRLNLK